jgi:hypothetical protein
VNADDILRPILLRHFNAARESWEQGHAILAYYAVEIARYYGADIKIAGVRVGVDDTNSDDIEYFSQRYDERRIYDEDGKQIVRPFHALVSSHHRFFNHIRALIPHIADDQNPDDVVPWNFGPIQFDSNNAIQGLQKNFSLLGKVNWDSKTWQGSFNMMSRNAKKWRKWFKWAEDQITNAKSQTSEMSIPAIDGEWSAPMTRTEMARRITGKKKPRPREVDDFLHRHGLEHVSGRKCRVRLDNMDKAMRGRLEEPLPE